MHLLVKKNFDVIKMYSTIKIIYTHLIKWLHHFCICNNARWHPEGRQNHTERIRTTCGLYSSTPFHCCMSSVCIRQLWYTLSVSPEHSRIVCPICTPQFSCESIPQMDRGVSTSAHQAGMQETYEIMFTSGMGNDSSGERFEVLTEALVKIQSSGKRCCVTGQVAHDVSRTVVSSSSGSSSPQRILMSHLYCILSLSSSSSSSLIHSTSLPSLPTSQQFSTDTAFTIPSYLPPSVASHYPHHQYL